MNRNKYKRARPSRSDWEREQAIANDRRAILRVPFDILPKSAAKRQRAGVKYDRDVSTYRDETCKVYSTQQSCFTSARCWMRKGKQK